MRQGCRWQLVVGMVFRIHAQSDKCLYHCNRPGSPCSASFSINPKKHLYLHPFSWDLLPSSGWAQTLATPLLPFFFFSFLFQHNCGKVTCLLRSVLLVWQTTRQRNWKCRLELGFWFAYRECHSLLAEVRGSLLRIFNIKAVFLPGQGSQDMPVWQANHSP